MNNLNRAVILSFVAMLVLGCSTATFRYESQAQDGQGRDLSYRYEKSYDLGSNPVLCGLTGIFWGGWCWTYTGMPNSSQETQVKADAQADLQQKLGTKNFKIKSEAITRVSWGNRPPYSSLANTEQKVAFGSEADSNKKPDFPALSKPLSIESFNLEKPEKVILDKARLELTLRNGGSKRIIAYRLKVRLSTSLNGEIGIVSLSSEDSSIISGETESATFEFTDNIWSRGDAGERLAAASNETLEVKLVDQKVIFEK